MESHLNELEFPPLSGAKLDGGDQTIYESNATFESPTPLESQDGDVEVTQLAIEEEYEEEYEEESMEDPCMGCFEPESHCICEDPYDWKVICRSCGHNSYTQYGCSNCGRDDPDRESDDEYSYEYVRSFQNAHNRSCGCVSNCRTLGVIDSMWMAISNR